MGDKAVFPCRRVGAQGGTGSDGFAAECDLLGDFGELVFEGAAGGVGPFACPVWPAAARTKRRCRHGGGPSGDLIHEYFSAAGGSFSVGRCSILFSSDFVLGSLAVAVAEQDAVQAVNYATNERLQPRAQELGAAPAVMGRAVVPVCG
ncbi:hypothetical protein [Streptomyces sp. DH41]|uniref:hypothetical protein n=1 Tax=Streptomyces sp. DH41 TaxID=3040125 RepID=UPI002440FA70|nr:hypothetical protein [Streptomyces sp. DH41]MDG9723282.1 hypothetical protein [Streptomyces sp. DH41]